MKTGQTRLLVLDPTTRMATRVNLGTGVASIFLQEYHTNNDFKSSFNVISLGSYNTRNLITYLLELLLNKNILKNFF